MKNIKKKQNKQLLAILESNDIVQQKALFLFDDTATDEEIILKFNIWARHHHPKFFSVKDAEFHKEIDKANVAIYRGNKREFLNWAFRGASKTTRTKLFIAFCIANDEQHTKKYIKVLSYDTVNGKQFVTDIYNLLISPTVKQMYPEIFEKTDTKREETMSSFTTSTGVKLIADTVGASQRGAIQEESRPDIIIFDDFETRETLRSAVRTKAIWDNMQEARDGLAVDGAAIYLGNYVSELGNVHRLTKRADDVNSIVLNVPIIEHGEITWPDKYSKEDIDYLKKTADDFEGEYLGKPSASKDIYFDREILDAMPVRDPIEEIAGFKVYKKYDASHRYAGGHDVAGGVGLDSSTSVFIDFSTVPAQVVGTFASNTIQPEAFGDEIYSQSNRFGQCLVAPENNKFDQTVLKAKQLGAKIYKSVKGSTVKTLSVSQPTYTYGWNTNSLTKSNMFNDLRKAVHDGLLLLNDPDLINEAKSYTRNDLIDKEPDPRLITRHFDLLTACAIAWAMKDHAEKKESPPIQIRSTDEEVNVAL